MTRARREVGRGRGDGAEALVGAQRRRGGGGGGGGESAAPRRFHGLLCKGKGDWDDGLDGQIKAPLTQVLESEGVGLLGGRGRGEEDGCGGGGCLGAQPGRHRRRHQRPGRRRRLPQAHPRPPVAAMPNSMCYSTFRKLGKLWFQGHNIILL